MKDIRQRLNSSHVCYSTIISRHLLIAFGGLGGLEENFEEDTDFKVHVLHVCNHILSF